MPSEIVRAFGYCGITCEGKTWGKGSSLKCDVEGSGVTCYPEREAWKMVRSVCAGCATYKKELDEE